MFFVYENLSISDEIWTIFKLVCLFVKYNFLFLVCNPQDVGNPDSQRCLPSSCAWPWLWLCRMNESWSCTARTTTRRWGSQTKPFSRHFVREYHWSYCIQFVHCTVVYYHYMLICPTLPHSSLFYCIVFPLLPFPLPHIFFLFFPAHLLSSKFLSYDFLLF